MYRIISTFVDNIYKVALFVMPFAIINDMTGEWPLGEKACQIWIRFALLLFLLLTKIHGKL